ncbi:hypothetical protein [Methanocaldococcus fervens]|uniref:Uncharacterized protein n=1 Tax=Methanocaldococcus fervens (strain DSM 4213 / JCM 15782 / AG86) TaxID=573064 RepID=C7P9P8_METFA|nr:hypothetical protein [Methanocaldococcus fervens]ACV25405.1 hypothetical protein Mefer_1602 [Methanocaldococcus fervens AG86]
MEIEITHKKGVKSVEKNELEELKDKLIDRLGYDRYKEELGAVNKLFCGILTEMGAVKVLAKLVERGELPSELLKEQKDEENKKNDSWGDEDEEICPRCGGTLEEICDGEGRVIELYCEDCGYKEIIR